MKKKLIALLLAAIMLLTFAACAPKTAEPATDAPTDGATEDAAEGGDAATINTVVEGKLTMVTNVDFPPYEFYQDGAPAGIDPEIATKIAEKLGLELVIEDINFDSIVPSVQSGKADIGMAGMTVTDERKLSVNFSNTYATGIQSIVVPEGSPITTYDDLANNIGTYTIGVQLATTGDIYASGEFGAENVEQYEKGTDAILALTSGKIDCVIIDNEPAKAFVAANEGLVILDTEYAVEDYAIATNKDNAELTEQINNALKELIEDGSVQEILDKYITAN